MANNQVSVEITLEEKAALKALTQLTKEVQKTEGSFKKMGDSGDESLGALGQAADGVSAGFKSLVGGVTVANLASDAIIGTARAVKDFVLDSVNAAIEQENAINRLNQALRSSGSFSKEASEDLQQFASSLQSVSVYGDEVIVGQLALAKSFGATNEQSKQLVQAAANLAATFGGSLEERVQQLGKAMNGTVGRLAQIIPELKSLTKAQLDAGAAADIINSKFGSAAENELKTYGGQVTAMKNAISDFQEELGGLVTSSSFVSGAIGTTTKFFQELIREFQLLRIESKLSTQGFTESGAEVEALAVEYANLTRQLDSYQKIAQGSQIGLDLRTINDAKTQVYSLTAELARLEAQINLSSNKALQANAGAQPDKKNTVDTRTADEIAKEQEKYKKLEALRMEHYAQLQISEAEYAAYENEKRQADLQITTDNRDMELQELIAFEQEKVNARFAAEEAKNSLIQDAQAKEYADKKTANDKLIALDKARVDATKKFDIQEVQLQQQKQAAILGIIGATANLATAITKDGTREQFLIQKAAAIAQAIVATNMAATLALAVPPAPNVGLAAYAKAAGAINIAAIVATAIKGYEKGGIIPGTSITGDNVPAMVNSGEMILNRQQQTELFKLANGSGGSTNLAAAIEKLADAIAAQPVNLNLDGRKIAESVRNQVQQGFRLA